MIRNNISLVNENYGSMLVKPIMNIDRVEDDDLNQEEKKTNLAENERKLEELYSMQTRLSQLKGIINHFNGLKQSQKEMCEQKSPGGRLLDLSEQTKEISQKIKSKLNESLSSNLKKKTVNIKCDKEDLSIAKLGNQDEISEGEAYDDVLLEEHKKKLSNAKEKLKQLQDLIVKLQVVSTDNSPPPVTKPKEDLKPLDALSDIEKLKTEAKLSELKHNKERLLRLLKEKESESEILTKLYSSHANQQPLSSLQSHADNEPVDFEIENKFASAEGDFDAMSIENVNGNQSSPSDLLWTQMRKQLSMRDNLRNKKKELEDLIRDVNTTTTQPNDES
jgi:hypothetical protein